MRASSHLAPFGLGVLLTLGGCAGSGGGPATSSGPSLASSGVEFSNEPHAAQRDGGVTVERPEACAVLRGEVDRVTAHASEHERLFAAQRDRLAVFGTCRSTAQGAWAVVLDQLEPVVLDLGATSRLQGHWALVHTDAEGGQRATRSPAMPSAGRDAADDPVNFVAGHPTAMRVHEPLYFDYDGAGELEVVAVVEETTAEYGTTTRGRVWSLRGRAIEPYGPARELIVVGTRDADNDGRPDLLTHGPYVGEWGDYCTRHATAVAGPSLLAHALRDGGFSLTDEAAVAAAREACPEDPDPLVAADSSGAVDNARTARNVACARLRGTSAARVSAAIRAGCRRGRRAAGARACVQGCNDVGMLLRWASAAPPVRAR